MPLVIYFHISHILGVQIQRPTQLVFKLFLCVICINFSYFFCNLIISLNSSVSLAIRGVGESILNSEICFSNLLNKLNSSIFLENSGLQFFSFDGLIKSMLSIGLLNLALSYALRYIMILVFILISPFAFLSLILQNTTWIFKSWVKIFLSLLLLQWLIPLILMISFSFNYSESDVLSKLLYVGSVYALTKANSYIRDFMGGLSSDVNLGISNLKSTFRS